MELEYFRQNFEKSLKIRFIQYPSNGNQVVLGGRRDGRMGGRTDGQMNTTKLILAFRNFANALSNT
jgi:hypothetical protein